MRKSASSSSELKFNKQVIEKILNWSMSRHEVGFLLFGDGNTIFSACRVRNMESDSKNYFSWDLKQKRSVIKEMSMKGIVLMAEGHSHPSERHPKKLSKLDLEYFNKKYPHILIHSVSGEITAWNLSVNERILIQRL